MTIGGSSTDGMLGETEVRSIVGRGVEAMGVRSRSVLVIVPDRTRTCPLPLLARAVHEALSEASAARVDFLIALGSHAPPEPAQVDALFGVEEGGWAATFGESRVFNHEWANQDALRRIGILRADEVGEITGGLFELDVDVSVNSLVFDYDCTLIVGPVFPHEVVGFSGGNKYFFPGICGPELLNYFHWLGAVITSPKVIGVKDTPVRATIDRAAAMLPIERYALCLVVTNVGLAGMFFGSPEEAWSPAADLSSKLHVTYLDRPFASVLAAAPPMYTDVWTAGKCMYKLEPVVADGGELIIYAPHITELSYTHGALIDQVGYHIRDYFLDRWDEFKGVPWGILAHSTHVRGIGTMADGRERCRIRVSLATGIPEERCRRVNLGYRDPASLDPADWQDEDQGGRLYVPGAGERLFKLTKPPAWQAATG